MPSQLSQDKQNQIVELYKAGKTYSEIEKATGARGYLISKYVKKAGLPKRKGSSPATSAAAPLTEPATVPPPPPASAPSLPSGTPDLDEFQPPPPPAPKPAAQTYQCDHCRALFRLDPGETLATAKCPACGETP